MCIYKKQNIVLLIANTKIDIWKLTLVHNATLNLINTKYIAGKNITFGGSMYLLCTFYTMANYCTSQLYYKIYKSTGSTPGDSELINNHSYCTIIFTQQSANSLLWALSTLERQWETMQQCYVWDILHVIVMNSLHICRLPNLTTILYTHEISWFSNFPKYKLYLGVYSMLILLVHVKDNLAKFRK